MKRTLMTTLYSGLAGLVVIAGGCGGDSNPQPGGGASTEPSVTMRSSEIATGEGGGSAGDSSGGGGASKAGGSGAAKPVIKEGFGNLKGVVKLDGAAPTMSVTQPNKDQEVCIPYTSERLVTGADGGVANVFIYLDKAPKNAVDDDAAEAAVIFDQKDCIFLPHAMVVRTGQDIKIKSDDPIAHNTHTKPTRNTEFNSTIPPDDREGKTVFSYRRSEKEPVRVVCDYHSWMEAWQLPVDHPYAAVTDKDGNFEIPKLPSGTYKFQVWHEGCGFLTKALEVTIQADEDNEITIDYPASRYTAQRQRGSGTLRIALSH